eukprot:CAMPEP_0171299200 /NCGR_PEP_ID=MMETSP0816-20121228/8018_1 /TAXON_ID=420281 /ORGANISM="Proboscia inermis, Strain CCAP1064/1" /LENGTH=124 /DNA_ID=CAMNT_0011774829 /DNA_START=177 /DNA_END=552 /DNA_ORIENTATION=-
MNHELITASDLLYYCTAVPNNGLLDHVDFAQFTDLIEQLIDHGLFHTEADSFGVTFYSGNTGFLGGEEGKVKLDVQMDDVECALDKTLRKENFYSTLMEDVKIKFSRDLFSGFVIDDPSPPLFI